MSLTIDTARLDLATARIMKLSEIAETDAGVRCGPKAAELGRLKRLFPTRVSEAAVIPFGVFLKHVDRPAKDGGPSPYERLKQAYVRYQERAKTEPDAAEYDTVVASGEIRLNEELVDYRRIEPSRCGAWKAGTGIALRDWLRSRGFEPEMTELPG